ncbi:Replicative DNA helicase [Patulibacter medicamentivorans]|uniref:Replicative DNA helicase n=1 Tax=Patulibacter medicamentivorans TaxID=1097667 RepID=H0E9H4_9ACTN|nr:replicative DNA helicase [Patulibacter medicamentivorans]EHN09666.1 Replicative DNA helicase [Patulibacter medicamentivorans]
MSYDDDHPYPADDGYLPPPDEMGPAAHVPPHDIHAEQAVLGALMLSEQARYAVTIDDGLRADDFYAPQHQATFEAIRQLYGDSQPVDSITVVEQLRRSGTLDQAGGREAVWQLTSTVTEVAALPKHSQIVRELGKLRRLLQATYEIQADVLKAQDDPAQIVEQAQGKVFEVSQTDASTGLRAVRDFIDDEVKRLEELEKDGRDITGLATGYRDLDIATAGLQPGAMIVLAARPAMGKSALVTNLAENVALQNGGAVALFSLEMPERELLQRVIASQAAIKGDDVRKGRIGDRWPDVLEVADKLAQSPLYVDDSSDIGIMEIRAKARRLAASHAGGVSLVIVDYLQLMRADGRAESRVQQVGEMSRGLKILAQELSCPVIALSQLSRAVESRPDKRPMLSDLRESGNIEQDADLVMFLYRDEYYNEETAEPGVAELIIAKNRSGRLATVRLLFQNEYPRFLTMAQRPDDGPPGQFSGGQRPVGAAAGGMTSVGGPPLPGGGPPLPRT